MGNLKFDIALGRSRMQAKWKNVQMTWGELAERLQKPTITQETKAEFLRMKKAEQDNIKDVGGFVGGYLTDGRRSKVKHRQLVCLDADYAVKGLDVWAGFIKVWNKKALLYSTHKHQPEKPRLRLVILLDRPVAPDEYQAIARKIAQKIGIDAFDDTTYQPQRLMYWPSHSIDGEYVFRENGGDILSADSVLAEYVDWKDITAWPTSSRFTDIVESHAGKKQKDPREKDGIVGTFCRTYTIREAIEKFVPDYQPCGDDRYTYVKGSTSAGVVIYNDVFSYSHHSTDPASGVLCNAFDLVRLHKFGELDEDVKAGTPVGKFPSWTAMKQLVYSDKKVIEVMSRERLTEQGADLALFENEGTDLSWTQNFILTNKGAKAQIVENVKLVLENDPLFKDRIGFNELENAKALKLDQDWKPSKSWRRYRDVDGNKMRNYFGEKYDLRNMTKVIDDAVAEIANANRFDPIRSYLDKLKWDGNPRVDTLLIDYLAAEDTELTRAVTRKTLCGAIARAYRPGTKFDTMLIFAGKQGLGKSLLWKKLGKEWFSDSLTSFKGKDGMEQLQGRWIIEIGELAAFRRSDVNDLKQFISKTDDTYRGAYKAEVENLPRRCIFVGTTNDSTYLRDTTGNRRYWPVYQQDGVMPTKRSWDLTDEDIDQIWAEAKFLWENGETLYLDKDLSEEMLKQQERAMDEDPRKDLIVAYLEKPVPKDWYQRNAEQRAEFLDNEDAWELGVMKMHKVCAAWIWEDVFRKSVERMDLIDARMINSILDSLPDWSRRRVRIKGRVHKGFARRDGDPDEK